MAIADAVPEQVNELSRPDKGEIFLSRREDLRLIRVPRYPQYGAAGQKVGELPGQAIQFRANRFFCPDEGTVELADGQRVDALEIMEWLKGHKLIGNVAEGFWVVDRAAPPVSQGELRLLMEAAMAFDEPAIESIIGQERDGWGRQALIEEAERALAKIREVKAEAAKQAKAGGK